jgi:hypothetical protein
MKQRAETKADIEEKIDQCNRRLGLISDNLNELKAARADLEDWQRNLVWQSKTASVYRRSVLHRTDNQAPPRWRTLANHHPTVTLPQG